MYLYCIRTLQVHELHMRNIYLEYCILYQYVRYLDIIWYHNKLFECALIFIVHFVEL